MNGRVRPEPITVGIADSLYTEIQSGGVHEGDEVVVGLATPDNNTQEKLPPGFEIGPKMR